MLNLHNAEFLRSAVKGKRFPIGQTASGGVCRQVQRRKKLGYQQTAGPQKLCARQRAAGQDRAYQLFRDRQEDVSGRSTRIRLRAGIQSGAAAVGALMETYFALGLLTVGIQIVDIRHKPTRDDVTMADWFRASDKPWIVVANKLDKIKKSQLEGNLAEIRQTLLLPAEVPVIPFSAEKGIGRDEVLAHIYGYIGKEGSEQ